MKDSILKVAEHLENGTIDSDKARSLLLDLFGVSRNNADSEKLVECSNCGDKVKMISSGEFCPHCLAEC